MCLQTNNLFLGIQTTTDKMSLQWILSPFNKTLSGFVPPMRLATAFGSLAARDSRGFVETIWVSFGSELSHLIWRWAVPEQYLGDKQITG